MTKRDNKQRGGTLLGFIGGLVVGLAVAVVVSLYINKGPTPFETKVDHRSEPKATTQAPNSDLPKTLPDPNMPLYAKNTKNITAEEAKSAPSASVNNPNSTDINTTNNPNTILNDSGKANTKDSKVEVFYIQTGAFQNPIDADNQRAKLAFAGYEPKVTSAEVSGKTMYRVRIGPFKQEVEANEMRIRLLEGGIQSAIVH